MVRRLKELEKTNADLGARLGDAESHLSSVQSELNTANDTVSCHFTQPSCFIRRITKYVLKATGSATMEVDLTPGVNAKILLLTFHRPGLCIP